MKSLSRYNLQSTFRQDLRRRSYQCLYSGARNLSHIKAPSDDKRVRLSNFWYPTGGIAESPDEDSHAKLVRAGYLRQAHSGIFHMLPLGLRVQNKVEALIDKHMSKIGASKVSLSSISSEELWSKSGRLSSAGSELFRFKDRKESSYLLSPTHEEEITSLVSSTVKSYREFPIRLYQISRKYRDELRPRQGLLRSREFLMKDLYTFDYSSTQALASYEEIRRAYSAIFDELKVPYAVAEADSGDIGGDLSHEYHFYTSKGEDNVISCSDCGYTANEELAYSSGRPNDQNDISSWKLQVWRGISRDRKTLVNVWYPSPEALSGVQTGKSMINLHAVKSIVPGLDSSIEDALPLWAASSHSLGSKEDNSVMPRRLVNLVDLRIPKEVLRKIESQDPVFPFWPQSLSEANKDVPMETVSKDISKSRDLNLISIQDGDLCGQCGTGTLNVRRTIELGHTFHLGTRYSKPMDAMISVPENLLTDSTPSVSSKEGKNVEVPMEMGCHGIGVSRIIGAVADQLATKKGLNWPRAIAPFEAVIITGQRDDEIKGASQVYESLATSKQGPPIDLVLDDRHIGIGWKLNDADLIGYPVIVVVGRSWKTEQKCEVQCHRLGVREECHIDGLAQFVQSLLVQL